MKKSTIITMLTVFCLALSACGNNAPADKAETETAETETAESQDETIVSEGDKEAAQEEPESKADFDYVGVWRYDNLPLYIEIDANNRWKAYAMTGFSKHGGDVVPEGDKIVLNDDDTSFDPFSITSAGDGKLQDSDGDLLSREDKLLFIARKDDPLINTTTFPGDKFGNVTISYPEEMKAEPRTDIAHALDFGHTLTGLAQEDFYNTIMIRFQPVTDYDEYLQRGSWLAQYAMSYMLNDMTETFYRDYVVKSIGSSFEDKGSYYSIKGYLWFNGKVFKQDIEDDIRGVMELRYYGPTGYVLMAVSVAPENRIENLSAVASNILSSCSYTTGWTTAPKSVPKAAGQKKSASKPKKKPAGSDSGDYGDAYYWTDSDGDIWYWNGRENVFVSFGDDGYIDDDGEYYESNDAGWDTADNYIDDYEIYSDPGDGYDAWSDPGDYYDDSSDLDSLLEDW